jgi:cysteine-rich repeat protein
MEESGKRSGRTGRRRLGLGLAAALAFVSFQPSFALAVCGDTVVDAGEDCDDGNASGGDCCSAACAYETGGSACADDGSVCTIDLCDGEGACIHQPGNAGTECRPDGRIVGLGAVDADVLLLPVAIAETWFQTHECGDGSTLQLYPVGGVSCAAWHTYNTTPGSAANLKAKVQGILNETYTPPAATAGSTTFNLVGGTISSAMADIVNLYNTRKNGSGEWTVRVPVFAASVCANFTSTLQITGFATVTIHACSNTLIQAYVDCVTLTSGSEGPADYGTVVGGDTECDVAETCDGVNPACPADVHEPYGTACGADSLACTADVCDGAGGCTHFGGNIGAICRTSAGACDPPESCNGAAACPADAKSTAVCRAPSGVCDVAETCDGASSACPADGFAVGAVCRLSAGECDAAESCGAAAACPADGNAPTGTPCGDPTATACSAPDSCDDLGFCDEKNVLPGTACEDGDPCMEGDTCAPDGRCVGGPVPRCDDGHACTIDECAPETGVCTFETRPATGCRSAGKSTFSVSTSGEGKARWKWGRGEATSCGDLGTPDADTGYDVCVFDGAGDGTYDLAAHFALPANGLWDRSSACRWTYKDRSGASDGLTGLKLSPRDAGRASIQISVEGALAPLPEPVAADRFMNADQDVTVQIVNSAGVCWESRLTESRKNTGEAYKGTGGNEF